MAGPIHVNQHPRRVPGIGPRIVIVGEKTGGFTRKPVKEYARPSSISIDDDVIEETPEDYRARFINEKITSSRRDFAREEERARAAKRKEAEEKEKARKEKLVAKALPITVGTSFSRPQTAEEYLARLPEFEQERAVINNMTDAQLNRLNKRLDKKISQMDY